jgi:hypothetical protein|tara:strand:- start:322 stop:633 length:312 start_codon:yes stop_codon:yes gene_type:complete
MRKISDVDSVMDEAVRTYRIVSKLRILRRGPPTDYTAHNLAEDYPDHYTFLGSHRNIRFIGKSAGEILEDYLLKLGYSRGSDLWFSLAQIVVKRGEFLDDGSI